MQTEEVNLKKYTRKAIRKFLQDLNNHKTSNLMAFVMDEIEKGIILEVLDFTNDNQTQSAEILGITRTTLRNKIKKHHLK